MMPLWKVQSAKPLQDYVVHVVFENGKHFNYSIKPLLLKEVFQELQDESLFKTVFVNPESKTVTWKNGADISPLILYQKYKESSNNELKAS